LNRQRPNPRVSCQRLLALLLFLLSMPVLAETTNRDLLVAARALGFLESPPTGEVTLGIVFDPSTPRSQREAENILRLIGGGVRSGRLLVRGQLLSLSDLTNTNIKLIFVSEFIGSSGAALDQLIASRDLLCITTDMELVRSGHCVMGVSASPRVEIVINREMADATDTRFSSMFRMMISEI